MPWAYNLKSGSSLRKNCGLWETGKPWGIRFYATRLDPGNRVNNSHPEISRDCCQCLDTQPLKYTAIGTEQIVSPLTNKTHCDWEQAKLMLEVLQGAETYLLAKTFSLDTSNSDAGYSLLWVTSSG